MILKVVNPPTKSKKQNNPSKVKLNVNPNGIRSKPRRTGPRVWPTLIIVAQILTTAPRYSVGASSVTLVAKVGMFKAWAVPNIKLGKMKYQYLLRKGKLIKTRVYRRNERISNLLLPNLCINFPD